jgi:hypothetical protein
VKGVRIAPLQPIFLEIGDDFHFGASTRKYIIRSKLDTFDDGTSSASKDDINLPEKEYELDVRISLLKLLNASFLEFDELQHNAKPSNSTDTYFK